VITLAFADHRGRLLDDAGLGPVCRTGWEVIDAADEEWIALPEGSTVTMLPGRLALARDGAGEIIRVSPDAGWAVGAVLPPGFTRTLLPAYEEEDGANVLPLFGYAALGFRDGEPVVTAVQTDSLDWWQSCNFPGGDIAAAIEQARAELPGNRLVDHLSRCATEYRCYTAQNTFYRRWEGALPVSGPCNAMCVGCISEQWGEVESPQDRIGFRPTVAEIVELAGWHLSGDGAEIVSFGQGCEGEPLMRHDLPDIVAAIRARHPHAFININTNGSRPQTIRAMIDAGLSGARVSVFSFNDDLFRAYYRPRDYGLAEVHETLQALHDGGCEVAINLLTFPGVSDDPGEIDALEAAIERHRIDQLQTRSLNIDAMFLMRHMPRKTHGLGMRAMLRRLQQSFPTQRIGNFTRGGNAPRVPPVTTGVEI